MDYSFSRLEIETSFGSVGGPVENYFLVQNQPSKHLAVVFPGAGYTAMGPMLYYSVAALTQLGADVLAIEYPATLRSTALSSEDRNTQLAKIAEAALEAGAAQKSYSRLTLVGKSMGTRALSSIVVPSTFKTVESIWLTPLLFDATLVSKIAGVGVRQFLATGTADKSHFNSTALAGLPKTVETFVVPNADHGLDIEGDVIASTWVMQELVTRIVTFLNG